jgi:hypothetical protein
MQPELDWGVGGSIGGWLRIEQAGDGFMLRGRRVSWRNLSVFEFWIDGHWALRGGSDGAGKNQDPSLRSG